MGARLSARLAERYGRHRIVIVFGWLRSLFPLGLAFVHSGITRLVTVISEGPLITCVSVFNPIYAAERLRRTPVTHAARVLSTWSFRGELSQAGLVVV